MIPPYGRHSTVAHIEERWRFQPELLRKLIVSFRLLMMLIQATTVMVNFGGTLSFQGKTTVEFIVCNPKLLDFRYKISMSNLIAHLTVKTHERRVLQNSIQGFA